MGGYEEMCEKEGEAGRGRGKERKASDRKGGKNEDEWRGYERTGTPRHATTNENTTTMCFFLLPNLKCLFFRPLIFSPRLFPGFFLVLSPVLVLGAAAVAVSLALLCSVLLGLSSRAEKTKWRQSNRENQPERIHPRMEWIRIRLDWIDMTCLELSLIDAGGDRTTDGSIRTYMYVYTYTCTYERPKERKKERKKENQKVGNLSLSLSLLGLISYCWVLDIGQRFFRDVSSVFCLQYFRGPGGGGARNFGIRSGFFSHLGLFVNIILILCGIRGRR
ncbi:uncharacterized protein K489DRAFT_130926 [Dissoconium aciculare CBS 342.82]|uniref:Uncharacterized protein n=1 Tax=Dissoconium aciculare CBS 342.82 TaxID=1314786 RepID=A0A6J3LSE6_9PEZI|nr:uncharacterized protein K489DRAFT_130926 [Dissoconium aciculare CBS 342.82]KAF1818214.1 hypothetical protein K489DRAFT_130926 [Dissoconium aciculare CBS 342.82]